MTSSNIVHGRLSLGSFIKLSVIAAIGMLPVLAIICGVAVLLGVARGHHSANSNMPDDFPAVLFWALLSLKAFAEALSIVIGGFFAGLCGYPFYSWLCRRKPGGVILKGQFDVL